MLFNSFEFVVFFIIVYGLYLTLRLRYQNILLLVASYVFYGWWDWRFLSLIVISTVVDYVVGIAISRTDAPRRRRSLLLISVVTNLGLLSIFKYYGFFGESLVELLATFDVTLDVRFVKIVLPVGISFYTFQTMSYTIDVFRGRMQPTRNFLNFAVFVAYFPQLVAGPIERASHLLPQVERKRTITYEMMRQGLWLILLGYFKKVVIADNMVEFTRPVFEDPENVKGLQILVGVYAFAWQIYGDFSGYTDIARGVSKIMGFDIMLNFRMPYFATNPSDFWRRWHISLSTWLRDYLYISMGGSRGGRRATYRNLMVTMVLGGLWHGAAWNFVVWGVFHGAILCIHRMLAPGLDRWFQARQWPPLATRIVLAVIFFHITCIGWLLFAVKRLSDVPLLFQNFFQRTASGEWATGEIGLLSIVFFAFPLLLIDLFQEKSGDIMVVKQWRPSVRLMVYMILFAYIVFCGVGQGEQFIYFQF